MTRPERRSWIFFRIIYRPGNTVPLERGGRRDLWQYAIDAEKNEITMHVSDSDLESRKKTWKMPAYKATRGTLAKYIRNVKSASLGCVTDE